ncbi:putative bifunctional diguanylate cyclase/phosphodiesterase [Methylobacterium sp. J-090]|uniref:putative bifunctional diguanylate cyclase/phosphodiesterase n=1 Tax=Methylobacterium sp. J-090 TaxID=2836666 RepID=UPI001FB8F7AF|nr:EAL domain-containing protein [Methylobacterium sp. J-090]MCJ2081164.1 EAL domain-containing protein [Methylobacterium sp. J-090]
MPSESAGLSATPLIERWQAARRSDADIPSYEAVVLGNLGRHADHAALVATRAGQPHAILWSGARFLAWLHRDSGSAREGGTPAAERLDVTDLSEDVRQPLHEVVERALTLRGPARTRCDRVHDGIVTSIEFLGIPLARRDDAPLVLVSLIGVQSRYDLVKAMFGATDQGMLALSTIRSSNGRVSDFKIVAANEGAARLLGGTISDLQWQRLTRVSACLTQGDVLGRLIGVITSERRDVFEVSLSGADGRDLHLKIEAGCIGDLLALTFVDVGDLKAREASARLLFENNPLPMWLIDQGTHRFLAVNDAALTHYGHSLERFYAMTLADLEPVVTGALPAATELYGPAAPRTHLRADGSCIEVTLFERILDFHGRSAVLTAVIDVTERRRAEARIAHMAHYDALTDLPNRVLFRTRLSEAIARHRPSGTGALVLFLDLDHFKTVNDTLGHSAGDELLRGVAGRLTGCLEGGDLVARMGGDEFAILVERDVSVKLLSACLIEAVSRPFAIQGQEVRVGVSIGVARLPRDGTDPDRLLRNADLALYGAKGAGRNTHHCFTVAMEAAIRARRDLEQDLRAAFAGGGLELYYQPVLLAASGRLMGFEALLRWRHPERGFISPAEFVPMAEETGLIGPIGEWVLRTACAEAASWPTSLRVAVNLSPIQFRDRGLPGVVRRALAEAGLAPDRLELEITETVLLAENASNLAVLHQLRALGARIAMDDFGTGYSSLGYLRSFPFDRIKIDRSFVSEMETHPEAAAIVRAIVDLGASLGILTTAEGIETDGQFQRLRAAGCDEVQGFLFGRPMPAGEIRGMMPDEAHGMPLRRAG